MGTSNIDKHQKDLLAQWEFYFDEMGFDYYSYEDEGNVLDFHLPKVNMFVVVSSTELALAVKYELNKVSTKIGGQILMLIGPPDKKLYLDSSSEYGYILTNYKNCYQNDNKFFGGFCVDFIPSVKFQDKFFGNVDDAIFEAVKDIIYINHDDKLKNHLSDSEKLLEVKVITDDESGIYTVGELDFSIFGACREYLETKGNREKLSKWLIWLGNQCKESKPPFTDLVRVNYDIDVLPTLDKNLQKEYKSLNPVSAIKINIGDALTSTLKEFTKHTMKDLLEIEPVTFETEKQNTDEALQCVFISLDTLHNQDIITEKSYEYICADLEIIQDYLGRVNGLNDE